MNKTFFLIYLFAISLSSTLFSQWNEQNVNGNLSFISDLDFYNDKVGIIAGACFDYERFNGRIFKTSDSGINWFQTNIPDSISIISSVKFITDSLIYGSGSRFLPPDLHNSYPGSLNNAVQNQTFTKHQFSSNNSSTYGYFLKSTDAGLNWFCYGETEYPIGQIHFNDIQNGYAVNVYDIIKTTNAGNSWFSVYSIEDNLSLNKIIFYDHKLGIAAGQQRKSENWIGVCLVTTDSGDSWEKIEIENLYYISDLNFLNDSTLLLTGIETPAKGFNGVVYSSTDFGFSWMPYKNYGPANYATGVSLLNNHDLIAITGVSQSTGIVFPFIDLSFDAGFSWKLNVLTNYPYYWPNNLFLINNEGGYIVGTKNGLIDAFILVNMDSLNYFEAELPDQITVYQNYPNPFNSETIIKFSIPPSRSIYVKQLNVTIKIYNSLGQLVSNLFNKDLSWGQYEVYFNADSLPSGIYFYQIKAGNYFNTKKMSFIK